MLLISRPSDACSGGIWHEQHGSPGTSAEGHKVPPGQDQGKESPPPSITPDLLLKMKGVWQKRGTTWDNTMLWAAVTLCFFGFFRSREITVPAASAFDEGAHLTFRDVSARRTVISSHPRHTYPSAGRKG